MSMQPTTKKIPTLTPEEQSRFWSKVQKKSDDECWEWMASKNRKGYGQFWLRRGFFSSHRTAYSIANGTPPEGLQICHTCDNPGCVNARHLFVGTHQDNVDDKVRKNRSPIGDLNGARKHPEKLARGDSHPARTHPEKLARGERQGSAKLTAADVLKIRGLEGSLTMTAIGKIYGVSRSAVRDILTRSHWKHI